jgi:hypothetical protein
MMGIIRFVLMSAPVGCIIIVVYAQLVLVIVAIVVMEAVVMYVMEGIFCMRGVVIAAVRQKHHILIVAHVMCAIKHTALCANLYKIVKAASMATYSSTTVPKAAYHPAPQTNNTIPTPSAAKTSKPKPLLPHLSPNTYS